MRNEKRAKTDTKHLYRVTSYHCLGNLKMSGNLTAVSVREMCVKEKILTRKTIINNLTFWGYTSV